jgi:hypothetical protein
VLNTLKISRVSKNYLKKKIKLRVKKNQLNAQLILSIFLQPLHVLGYLGLSSGGIYATIGTYYSF